MIVVIALAGSAVVFFGVMWLLIAAGSRLDDLIDEPLRRFADWRVHVRWRWENRG